MAIDLPPSMLTLWPKLESSLRLVEKWGGRTGIIFVTQDEQGSEACAAVASALGWPIVEFDEGRIHKTDFDQRVYDFVLQKERQGDLFAEKIDRICVIIPRIDRHGEWLSASVKSLCEHARLPFVLLATAHDESWMPSYLQGHLFVCRKRGAPKAPPRDAD